MTLGITTAETRHRANRNVEGATAGGLLLNGRDARSRRRGLSSHVARCAEAVQHDDRWTVAADTHVDLGAVGSDLEGVDAVVMSVVVHRYRDFPLFRLREPRDYALQSCARRSAIAPVAS
jgi:hypothetical protein